MTTETIDIEIADLPSRVAGLVAEIQAGEKVVIAYHRPGQVRISFERPKPPQQPRVFDMHPGAIQLPAAPQRLGFAKGSFSGMAPDFDAPLPEEFWLGDDA
ncbi:MAG: hypothetical protein ACRC7O_10685 [Fimbriiglobus sp.]